VISRLALMLMEAAGIAIEEGGDDDPVSHQRQQLVVKVARRYYATSRSIAASTWCRRGYRVKTARRETKKNSCSSSDHRFMVLDPVNRFLSLIRYSFLRGPPLKEPLKCGTALPQAISSRRNTA
jgi:hypothetical protein